MSLHWSERIDAWVDETAPPTLEQRVATLATKLADALEWLTTLAGESLDPPASVDWTPRRQRRA